MSHLPSPVHTSDEAEIPQAVLPSQRTIAFAISIVKSKPPELNIEEYIKLLRQHIAPGRQENALSSVYAHLDRSAYWRARVDIIKANLERSQDEAVDLRREIASLKSKLENRPSSPVKKRKKQDTDVILVPRSPKRTKRTASPDIGMPSAFDHATNAEFSQAGPFGVTLLRSVFYILAAFRTTQRTRPSELAYHIERASSTIPDVLQREIKAVVMKQTAGNDRLKNALAITTRAIATVFAGYTRLTHAHDVLEGTAVQGRVIYAIVVMFRSLLCYFQVLSAEEIDRALTANNIAAIPRPATAQTPSASSSKACMYSPEKSSYQGRVSGRPSTAQVLSPDKSKHVGISEARPSIALPNKSKHRGMPSAATSAAETSSAEKSTGKCRAQQTKTQKVKENAMLSLYTTFLGNIVDMLDPKTESNRPIFEGFAYCILDCLGKRLYSIVFGHDRGTDLEAEIKQDNDHGEDRSETDVSALHAPQQDDDERKQIKLEAPYLLHLLNRVMIAAPAHFGKAKANKAKTNKAPSKNTLAISAKECLQRTLINAIFGTESLKDDDPLKECLKMPTPGEGTLAMPKVKEVDVLEHFKEEVWRCLGWDILAREQDW